MNDESNPLFETNDAAVSTMENNASMECVKVINYTSILQEQIE